MRASWKLWTLLLGLGATGLVGCSGGQSPSTMWNSGGVGTLQVALTATAPSGATYRLDNAVFQITNFFTGFNTTVTGDDPTLNIDLAPSVFPFDYSIFLQDGWTLNEINPDGSATPLSATLLTNFIPFTIKSQRTTPISFHFKASEQIIATGNGTASVTISVDDSLIDDFEDGDGLIAPLGGRNGAWFTFNDGTGTQTPAPGTPVLPQVVDTIANFLLEMTATGFAPQGQQPDGTFAFGAGVGTSMVTDPVTFLPVPYNASKYTGINFTFFTNTSPNFPVQVAFLVSTSATAPVEQGGTCTVGCNDDFGFVGFVPPGPFSFTGGFTWGQLRQQGFGTPVAFDPSTILQIKWIVQFPNFGQTASDDNAEFRLDDVTFTTSAFAVPTGAGGGAGSGGGTGGAGGDSGGMGGRPGGPGGSSGGKGDAGMPPPPPPPPPGRNGPTPTF